MTTSMAKLVSGALESNPEYFFGWLQFRLVVHRRLFEMVAGLPGSTIATHPFPMVLYRG